MDALDFDVVVIGGGSAGCALAGRLVETTDLRLCLVEAGPDYGPAGPAWPPELLDHRRFPTSHDWGFSAVRGDGALAEPRGKVIGGCSTHNQCAAVWAFPGDYDTWAAITDDPTWSYRAVRRSIDDIEDATGGDPTYRGSGGRLPTRPYRTNELASWQRDFLSATTEAGFQPLHDLSAPLPDGAACAFQANVHDGTRWNAAFAFLDRVRGKPTLHVLAQTHAVRFHMRGATATALSCQTESRLLELRARQFVLCAGAYGSPATLLRSGIGPAQDLERLGIAVVADVPGVGANLHDHPGVAVRFTPTAQATRELAADLTEGTFHQSQVALRTAEHRLHVLPYQAAVDGGWSFHVIAFLMTPSSRGSVALSGTDAAAPPQVDFRFLSDSDGRDLAALRAGVDVVSSLARTPTLSSRARLAADVEGAIARDASAYIRANVSGYAHAVGTCRMGAEGDPDAVADATGLVRRTENVRVADASLIPVIPAANTNLTCMLIGWQLAPLVAAAATG